MDRIYEEELKKLRTGNRGNNIKNIKFSHVIIIAILIFVVYWAWQYGADEARVNKLTNEERNLTYEILKNLNVQPLPEDNYTTAKISMEERVISFSAGEIMNVTKKVSRPEETKINKWAIIVMALLILGLIMLLYYQSKPESKYISLEQRIALVEEHLERRGWKRKYEIGLAAADRWWKSLQQEDQVLDKAYIPFDLFTSHGVTHWICILDPRRTPETEGHIQGFIEIPEGWKGKSIKDIRVIELGRQIKTMPTGEAVY